MKRSPMGAAFFVGATCHCEFVWVDSTRRRGVAIPLVAEGHVDTLGRSPRCDQEGSAPPHARLSADVVGDGALKAPSTSAGSCVSFPAILDRGA